MMVDAQGKKLQRLHAARVTSERKKWQIIASGLFSPELLRQRLAAAFE
jgi:hypothetical protein